MRTMRSCNDMICTDDMTKEPFNQNRLVVQSEQATTRTTTSRQIRIATSRSRKMCSRYCCWLWMLVLLGGQWQLAESPSRGPFVTADEALDKRGRKEEATMGANKPAHRRVSHLRALSTSNSDNAECIDNMEWADANNDGRLNEAEFGAFVTIQSGDSIVQPMQQLSFVTIFVSEACTQCTALSGGTTPSDCCIGSNAHIDISSDLLQSNPTQYWDTIDYVCSAVLEQLPTAMPTSSMAPSDSPAPSTVPSSSPSSPFPSAVPSTSPQPTTSSAPTGPVTWQLVGDPVVSENGEGLVTAFGHDVAFVPQGNDKYLVVGEPHNDNSTVGQVTLHKRPLWQTTTPDWNVTDSRRCFGHALDAGLVSTTSGHARSSLLVGAPGTINPSFPNLDFGSAHYFQWDEATGDWTTLGTELGVRSGGQPFESSGYFGSSVAMARSMLRIAVGAPSSSTGTLSDTGRVYTFDYNGMEWDPLTTPLVGEEQEAALGTSVALSYNGNRLLMGAPGRRGGDGQATFMEWTGTEWRTILNLAGVSESSEAMGTTVAIVAEHGRRIAVGAPFYDDGTGGNRGMVRVYEEFDSLPGFFQRLGTDEDFIRDADDASDGDRIGTTLCGAKGLVCFGTDNGSFRVYDYDGTNWVRLGELSVANLGSPVVSITMSETADSVAVGLANREVQVFELTV